MERIKFNPEEIAQAELYPARPGFPAQKKYKSPITPRENYKAFYKHEVPLWFPTMTDRRMFAPRVDPDNIARGMVMDETPLKPEEMVGGRDRHNIEWVYVPKVGGSMVKPGNPTLLDVNDWEKVVSFPDVASWDWENSEAQNRPVLDKDERAIYAWVQTGIFERLISLMDFDAAAVALIDDDQKDAVKAFFDRLADLYVDMINRYKKAYNPQIFCLHDDWGSQRAPFFSLDTVMEMLVPPLSRVVKAAHDNDMFFDMHSCGKNEILVPAYIAAGIDSWTGQPMNDKDLIYEKYGDKLILGIEPDMELTYDTPADEAAECAKRFVAKYAANYDKKPVLCAASFVPPAFFDALYEESRKALN